jgi:DNA repair photolyase
MPLIYEPAGRAREYAALACNPYAGCDHACIYCYAPSATFKERPDFSISKPRKNFDALLEKEAAQLSRLGKHGQVLLSFTCDPYQHLDVKEQTTRKTIVTLHRHGFRTCTLTKGGTRALRDIDLFRPGDAFATTLTFTGDDDRWLEWEPRAASPADRIYAISAFHQTGIPTWVSLEPVIDPQESLELIRRTHNFVDLFKVGKMNYHPIAKMIDWRSFGCSAIQLLESLGYRRQTNPDAVKSANSVDRQYYIKRDLAEFL